MNLLATSMLCLALHAAPSISARAPTALVQDEDKAFFELERQCDDAARAWRKELSEARKAKDSAAEQAILARTPVKDFFPRFAALAESGSARAAFWMATRVEDVESDVEKIQAQKTSLFAQAIRGLGTTDAAADVLKALKNKKEIQFLGAPALEAFLLDLATTTKDLEVGSGARLARGKSMFDRAETAEEREQAVQALEELVKSAPESKAAKLVEGVIYEFRNLVVGCVAPDFDTQDVDGAGFKLSDYRGKVVLVDFWGFW